MSDKKVRVPQIRFAGFTEDWEERKLGEMLAERNEQIPENDEYPLMSFVQGAGVSPKGDRYDRSFLVKNDNKKYKKSELGDFIYSSNNLETGSIGFNRIGKAVISPVYSIFSSKGELESRFIGIVSERKDFIAKMIRFRQGVVYGQWRIHEKEFLNVKINVPSHVEQKDIIDFFDNLDNLITLQQRQLDKLASVKKTMLEKMFPKDGANVPEIRFAGFTGAWEQRKLGELTEVYDGTHQTPQYTDCGIMFLSVENIKSLRSDKYISEEAFKGEFKVFPEKGDVLMTRIGDIGTANVIETNEPIAYYVSLALLKRKELDPYFLKESIFTKTVKKELWHRTLHIAFPKKINKNEIEKVLVSYPKSKLEQEQIGSFFRSLDNLITLHQRELNTLKNLKKSMLQQLFV